MFREQIAMEGNLLRLAIGGFAGSWIFIFLLTAIGNVYSLIFSQNPQVRLFPEVVIALIFAVIGSAMVHRVCATTCFIFSMVALYYLNKISQSTYSSSQPGTQTSRLTRTTTGNQNGKSPSPKSPRKDRRSHH